MNYVQLPVKQPYTCLTHIEIIANPAATRIFQETKAANGAEAGKLHVLGLLSKRLAEEGELMPRLSNEREQRFQYVFDGPSRGESYHAQIGVRRVGEDTGRDILINTSGIIAETYEHMKSVLGTPKAQRSETQKAGPESSQ